MLTAPVGTFSAASPKTSTSRSPAFASSMIFLAIISSVMSPGRLTAARADSKATPMRRVVSGSKVWPLKKGLMGTGVCPNATKLANFTLSAVKPKSELNPIRPGTESMFWYFATSMRRGGSRLTCGEARMQKKCPDKQQNQEVPPLSRARDMPQPAPVDDKAFARRVGEIIGNSNTSLHNARGRGNKRPRRSG